MKRPTAAQKRRMAKVAELGCLNCGRPANIHHCRHECGMGQRNHSHICALCRFCHQEGPKSRHMNPKWFAENVGTDLELHLKTCKLLGEIE